MKGNNDGDGEEDEGEDERGAEGASKQHNHADDGADGGGGRGSGEMATRVTKSLVPRNYAGAPRRRGELGRGGRRRLPARTVRAQQTPSEQSAVVLRGAQLDRCGSTSRVVCQRQGTGGDGGGGLWLSRRHGHAEAACALGGFSRPRS